VKGERPRTNHEHVKKGQIPRKTQPPIEVHIEELVLHGFAPGDGYRIGAAVERELGRLFGEQGVPGWLTQGGEVERLDGGTFETAPGSQADTVGVQVAQALYGGLAK